MLVDCGTVCEIRGISRNFCLRTAMENGTCGRQEKHEFRMIGYWNLENLPYQKVRYHLGFVMNFGME